MISPYFVFILFTYCYSYAVDFYSYAGRKFLKVHFREWCSEFPHANDRLLLKTLLDVLYQSLIKNISVSFMICYVIKYLNLRQLRA